jgi:hypothetical protein
MRLKERTEPVKNACQLCELQFLLVEPSGFDQSWRDEREFVDRRYDIRGTRGL